MGRNPTQVKTEPERVPRPLKRGENGSCLTLRKIVVGTGKDKERRRKGST